MKAKVKGRTSILENKPSTPESRAKNLWGIGVGVGFVAGMGVGMVLLGVFAVAEVRGVALETGWDEVGMLFGAAAVFLVGSFILSTIVGRELKARNYDLSKSYIEDAGDD